MIFTISQGFLGNLGVYLMGTCAGDEATVEFVRMLDRTNLESGGRSYILMDLDSTHLFLRPDAHVVQCAQADGLRPSQ